MAGNNTVIFFAPTIFRAVGLSSAAAAILATAVFFLSAALTASACVFVAMMIPETRHVELEEIGALWRDCENRRRSLFRRR